MNNMKRANGVVGLALLLFPLADCSFSFYFKKSFGLLRSSF
jgi:hypothetical protein